MFPAYFLPTEAHSKGEEVSDVLSPDRYRQRQMTCSLSEKDTFRHSSSHFINSDDSIWISLGKKIFMFSCWENNIRLQQELATLQSRTDTGWHICELVPGAGLMDISECPLWVGTRCGLPGYWMWALKVGRTWGTGTPRNLLVRLRLQSEAEANAVPRHLKTSWTCAQQQPQGSHLALRTV